MVVSGVVAVLVLVSSGCQWMTWVSQTPAGGTLDASAGIRAITPDARYVVFASKATDAAPRPPVNGKQNLYRRDLSTGTTERITFTTTGGDPNQSVLDSSITADGRYVAFSTNATNMDASPVGGAVFVRDMVTGSVTRVDARGQLPSFSADGRYLAVTETDPRSGANNVTRYDRVTNTHVLTDASHRGASGGVLSADGSRVAFNGADLVPGATRGVFVHDFGTGTTTVVDVDTGGLPTNDIRDAVVAISADGNRVLYRSGPALHVRDLAAGTTFLATATTDGLPLTFAPGEDQVSTLGASLSGDGTHVAFWSAALNLAVGQAPHTRPDQVEVFVRDLTAGVTTVEHTTPTGGTADPYLAISESSGIRTALDGPGANLAFDGSTSQYLPSTPSTALNVFVRALVAPQPVSVVPAAPAAGSATVVTVTGTGFASDATLGLITAAGNSSGVAISAVHVTSPTVLTATITLAPSVAAGPVVVIVQNPPPGPGIVPASAGICTCLTISP